MSASLLYQGLGLKRNEYQSTEYLNETIFFHVKNKEAYQYRTNSSPHYARLCLRLG
jgi:hypothetical protein